MKKLSIIFFVILIAFSGCKKGPEDRPVRIAFDSWVGYISVFIAKEKGFFKKNGIDVELVFNDEYSKSQEMYKNGDLDGLFEVFTDTVLHNAQGIETKAVYILDHSIANDVIIARPGINSVQELKGKRIGIDGINSFSHLFILSALEKAGIKESEIYLRVVSAQTLPSAIEKGLVDAGHTWDPAKSELLKKGCNVLVKAGDLPGYITDVISFNAKFIDERPSAVEAFLRSMLEANNFIGTNRKEALEIMSKESGTAEDVLSSALLEIIKPDLTNNINEMDPGNPLYLGRVADKILKFFMQRGLVFSRFNVDEMIDESHLKKISK